jgi:hypothetical protein
VPGLSLLLVGLAFGAAPPFPPASDTFGDPGARALVEQARAARGRAEAGLESFDGQLWERVYVGFDAARFRRERAVFQQERSARIRWEREGPHVVRWEGALREVPVVGLSSAETPGLARDLARDLARGGAPPPLLFEPGSDRLVFGGGEWALHPLADTAGAHYRFHSGDTLRVRLPEMAEELVLVEVRVEPRRPEFRLLSASLWFDRATGALARAVYRPARPFDLELDQPEDAGEVPRLLRPIRAEIRLVSMDHSLQDLRWWIPRRFAFEGEGQVGRVVRFPLTVEWTVTQVRVNAPFPADLIPDPLPEGWTLRDPTQAAGTEGEEGAPEGDELPPDREEEAPEGDGPGRDGRAADEGGEVGSRGEVRPVWVVVPPAQELATGPGLSGIGGREAAAFSVDELREWEDLVRGLRPPIPGFRPSLYWGVQEGLTRFNRVEGLASGLGSTVPTPGGGELRAQVRTASAAPLPTGELHFRMGSGPWETTLGVYRRLVGSSEWVQSHSLGGSLGNLALGEGPVPYHRAWGGEAVRVTRGSRWVRDVRIFGERQGEASLGTDFHLRGLFGDRPLPEVPEVEEGTFFGAALEQRWQSGLDPRRPRVLARGALEGALGDAEYLRARGSTALLLPLGSRWAAGVELAAGWGSSALPAQRRFFPGGPEGYRGARTGERAGQSFWMARGEVGRGVPGARIVGFVDVLRMDPFRGGPGTPVETAMGGGVSFLDGLLRLEAGRRVDTGGRWRIHAYLDGLF